VITSGTAAGPFQGFPTSWHLAGKTGTASNGNMANGQPEEPNSWFVAFGPNPNPQYLVLAVIDQGGYGAQAAAPLVRNIFNYLVTNPVAPVKLPTLTSPPTATAPTASAPFGAPTTTTTAPKPGTGPATTTTTAPGGP
jgi:penicillin-binding protein 2